MSGSDDTLVKVWDINEKKVLATLKDHKKEIKSIVFSNDYKVLVSADVEVMIFWNATTYEKIGILLTGH